MTAHLHKQRLVTCRPYTNAVSAQLHETEGVLDVSGILGDGRRPVEIRNIHSGRAETSNYSADRLFRSPESLFTSSQNGYTDRPEYAIHDQTMTALLILMQGSYPTSRGHPKMPRAHNLDRSSDQDLA
jgi:hypothetical protein